MGVDFGREYRCTVKCPAPRHPPRLAPVVATRRPPPCDEVRAYLGQGCGGRRSAMNAWETFSTIPFLCRKRSRPNPQLWPLSPQNAQGVGRKPAFLDMRDVPRISMSGLRACQLYYFLVVVREGSIVVWRWVREGLGRPRVEAWWASISAANTGDL